MTLSRRSSAATRRSAGGFTLLELVVAASLVGLVAAAGVTLTNQLGEARLRAERAAAHHAEADAAISAIGTALQNLFRNHERRPLAFVGTQQTLDGRPADRLRFFTVSDAPVRPGSPESDVHEVEFYLEAAEENGPAVLMQRTDPTRNAEPDGGGVLERVAGQIVALSFEYFDGQQWAVDWPEDLSRLPVAVRVRVGVRLGESGETVRSHQRLVYLPRMPEANGGGGGGGGLNEDRGNGGGR